MKRLKRSNSVERVFYCGIIVLSGCILCLEQYALAHQAPQVNWNGIRKTYLAFIENPSSLNGEAFVKMLPETPILDAKEAKEKFETAMLIINPIETSSLRCMVLGGNRYALEAVFRLLNISDGALTEMLFILLGDVLKQQPRLYLETLEIYKDMDVFRLIGKYGVAMSIEPLGSKEEKAELQSRLDALETIKDEKFSTLRDACILELRKAINRKDVQTKPCA